MSPKAIRDITAKTLSARIRKLMPDIDQKIREGVSHADILETLETHDIKINLNTFRSYLYRFRKKNQSSVAKPDGNQKEVIEAEPLKNDTHYLDDDDDDDIDFLDGRSREKFSDKYLERKRPLFRSGKK